MPGELDTTIRLKYSLSSQPTLTTSEALANLLRPFGATDAESVILIIKAKSSKKSVDEIAKVGTAVVPFKQIGDAFAAVCASGVTERGLQGVHISWAARGGEEPPLIGWLKKNGKLGTKSSSPVPSSQKTSGASLFSSFPGASVGGSYDFMSRCSKKMS